jgi:hypothetical protein
VGRQLRSIKNELVSHKGRQVGQLLMAGGNMSSGKEVVNCAALGGETESESMDAERADTQAREVQIVLIAGSQQLYRMT